MTTDTLDPAHALPTVGPLLSIAAVERETGLSKDTLRVWERRYGFPRPGRDAAGERAYPLEQVDRLRVAKRLIDAGHRAGRVVVLPAEALHELAASTVDQPRAAPPVAAATADAQHLVQLLRAGNLPELRHALARALARHGVRSFLTDVMAPLNRAVGDAWLRGQLHIYQEHLYSELMQSLVRQALAGIPPAPASGARVLLTSLPGEPHGLGLLMAEAVFALEGCRCLPLGPQTPVLEIARAADALKADLVALGFAGCLGARQVAAALGELRTRLPARVPLWVGGSAPGLLRRPIDGVRRVDSLARLPADLRGAGFVSP